MFQYSQHTQIGKKVKTSFVTTVSIFNLKTNWDNFKKQFFWQDEKSMKVVFDRFFLILNFCQFSVFQIGSKDVSRVLQKLLHVANSFEFG
jgi:hypothetical protein